MRVNQGQQCWNKKGHEDFRKIMNTCWMQDFFLDNIKEFFKSMAEIVEMHLEVPGIIEMHLEMAETVEMQLKG